MSFLTQSNRVFFGRPLCLIPSTSHVIQSLTQSLSSFHSTCPNHLNLLFLIIKRTGSNPKRLAECPTIYKWLSGTVGGRKLRFKQKNLVRECGRVIWRTEYITTDSFYSHDCWKTSISIGFCFRSCPALLTGSGKVGGNAMECRFQGRNFCSLAFPGL